MKRYWFPFIKKSFVFLGSLIAFMTLLEGFASIFVGKEFQRGEYVASNWGVAGARDDSLGWRHRKSIRARILGKHFTYRVETNAFGYRDQPRQRSKPAGGKRVLVFGDSIAWGWGIDAEHRFSDRLEMRLGPTTEVVNMAVPGYGTDQAWLSFECEAHRFDPDGLVLCMVLNDLLESDRDQYILPKPRFHRSEAGEWTLVPPQLPSLAERFRMTRQNLGRWIVAHSAMVNLLLKRDVRGPATENPIHRQYESPSPECLLEVERYAKRIRDEDSAARYCLAQLANACQERGIPLIVVAVPFHHDQYVYEPNYPMPDKWPSPMDLDVECFQTTFSQEIEMACKHVGAQFVSVDHALLQASRKGVRLHLGDGHLNEAGHRLVADQLEPVLRGHLASQDRRIE